MRGFGSNQAQFAMEGIMDILAEKLGIAMSDAIKPPSKPKT
jgi:CO/xanthine dehydrogenase Mo-binding subunit